MYRTAVTALTRPSEIGQVSEVILQGRIPSGNEFEKFIPLFSPTSRWYACATGLVFTVLAIIMFLPDTLQAMVRLRIAECFANELNVSVDAMQPALT